MRVIAIKLGFFGGHRVRIGQEFDIPEKDLKQEGGKSVLPSWVVEATPENRQKLADGRKFEAQKAREAALAAAGPKRTDKQHKRGFAVREGAEDLV